MAPKKVPDSEESKKRKAPAPGEPAKKEAKRDEAEPAEKEKDAPKDARPKLKEAVAFHANDTTLNVVPTLGGKVLMALSEGGMQYLIAGARANVGVKAGRYMYEVKIIEALNPAESSGVQRARVPVPRQLVRLGFSTSTSHLLLGDGNESAFFDSEGFYVSGKGKKTSASQRFTRDQIIAVVLNLDPKSPNCNTLSLFREGERIAEPQPLPEHLIGKPLFPHVSFRNVTVQMLFGPVPAKQLPFQCRMLQAAAQADVQVLPSPEPADGKYEVMVPVSLPDEGSFDWLDDFLEKNPHYVEISDRRILEWAASSGLWKPKGGGWKTSNDRPEFNFGLPGMDDFSIRRVLYNVTPVVPRNYVIMEVKSNLIATERKDLLGKFSAPFFKKVAHVVVGEPNEEYKGRQQERLLKEKQEKAESEWRAKKAEEERKKQVEQRQRQLQEMRQKAEEARRKAAEEARRKREEAERKRLEEGGATMEGLEGAGKEEEAKPEDASGSMEVEEGAKEEGKEEGKEDEVKEEEKEEEKPPQVELTDEERKTWHRPAGASGTSDLSGTVMSQSFSAFSLPGEEETFDLVRYEWQGEQEARDYLAKWIKGRKLTSRIEDLQPGQWFTDKLAEWQKTFAEWQGKQREYNQSAAKRAKDEERRRREEEKKGDEMDDEAIPPPMETDNLDIFSVEDVCDVGNGEPLFASFTYEDWALLQLRFDLYFLQLSFKKDVDDPERLGIHESHLAFYYNKYFRRQLNPKYYGLSTNAELVRLVKDTVFITEDTQVLASVLDGDMEEVDIFAKLTEENRRERQRRIDAGDETAKLKFSAMALQHGQQKPATGPSMPMRGTGGWPHGQASRPYDMGKGGHAGGPGGYMGHAGGHMGGVGQYSKPGSMGGGRPMGSWPRPSMMGKGGGYGQKWR